MLPAAAAADNQNVRASCHALNGRGEKLAAKDIE
jgi:hypothetical protein